MFIFNQYFVNTLFQKSDARFWVPFSKQLLLRNCAADFVEICNVYFGKMIIKAAKSIFNSDKICRSYSDLNFGVTFLGTQCIIINWQYFLMITAVMLRWGGSVCRLSVKRVSAYLVRKRYQLVHSSTNCLVAFLQRNSRKQPHVRSHCRFYFDVFGLLRSSCTTTQFANRQIRH